MQDGKDAQKTPEEIAADQKAAEIASFNDRGDGPAVEVPQPPPAPEEPTKEAEAKPEPDVKLADAGSVKPELPPDISERLSAIEAENKRLVKDNQRLGRNLQEMHDRLRTPAAPPVSGENHNEDENIDPDVLSFKKKVIEEAKGESVKAIKEELAREETERKREIFNTDYAAAVKDAGGEEAYQTTVQHFFLPSLQNNPELYAEWQASRNPAKFAFEKASEIKTKMLQQDGGGQDIETLLKQAREEGRKQGIDELTKNPKIIGSLGSIPGGGTPKGDKLSDKEREIRSF